MTKVKSLQIPLFNGEPVIKVEECRDGVFRFACKSHGKFSLSTRAALRSFMRRNKFKHYIYQQTNFECHEGEGA